MLVFLQGRMKLEVGTENGNGITAERDEYIGGITAERDEYIGA